MALVKKTAVDGLKKEDPAGAGADALAPGQAFLIDNAKTTPVWPNATNFVIHYAYGIDMGTPIPIDKLICYDNRDNDNFWTIYDLMEVWLSNDNVTYNFYQAFDGPTRTAGVWELVFAAIQTAQYFKVWCTVASGGLWEGTGNWIQLVELEAWGEEIYPKLSGIVQQQGTPVQRTVRSYVRSTGVLFDSAQSNPDGSFELNAPDTQVEMFVIAFDDDLGDQYNAVIYDKVKALE